MRQLTLNLSEEAYQRLFSEAEEKKQPVEKLAIERITTGSSHIVESAKRIQAKAKGFLQKHAGKILRIGNPELNLDGLPFWRVPIFLSTDSLSKSPLGVISISVSSGEILTTCNGQKHIAPIRYPNSFGYVLRIHWAITP